MSTCSVCSDQCTLACSGCSKVYYCGKEHQKKDRKRHKADCFPAKLIHSQELGNHLAATKNLKPGELIFSEQPLIVGPRDHDLGKVCLGCHRGQSSEDVFFTSCSRCRWPVCSKTCENESIHSEFECSVFQRRKVDPNIFPTTFLSVTILRCLLLLEKDPIKWKKLLGFAAHEEILKLNPYANETVKFISKFLQESCGMKLPSKNTVAFLFGIISINGYGDLTTFTTKLYSNASKLSHNCIPNTRTILNNNMLKVVAAQSIKCDEPLTQLYGRMYKGTMCRQQLLQKVYYFTCSCGRCQDETELGTNFSTLKCQSCHNGWLLPMKPMDLKSFWKCNNLGCNNTKDLKSYGSALDFLSQLIYKMTNLSEDDPLYSTYELYGAEGNPLGIKDEVSNQNEKISVLMTMIQHIEEIFSFMEKICDKVVHPNHYLLLPMKTALVATCHTIFTEGNFLVPSNLMEKFEKLVYDMLQVANVLIPGFTMERGILLFYTAECIRVCLSAKKGNNLESLYSKKFASKKLLEEKMNSAYREAYEIVILESEDDPQRQMIVKAGRFYKI